MNDYRVPEIRDFEWQPPVFAIQNAPPDEHITFNASFDGTLKPRFTFSSGSVEIYVDGVLEETLTSGVDGTTVVTAGQEIRYTVSDPTAVTELRFGSSLTPGVIDQFTGDIVQLAQFINCTDLRLNWCNLVTGNLSSIAALPLTELQTQGNSLLNGSLSSLSSIPLNHINMRNMPLLTGDLSDLPSSLNYIFLYESPGVTGDISDVAGFSGLDTLNLRGCDLITWTTGALDAAIDITSYDVADQGHSQATVDDMLASLVINKAARPGSKTCTVYLTGNSIPSAAGLASKATLAEGPYTWTVHTDV